MKSAMVHVLQSAMKCMKWDDDISMGKQLKKKRLLMLSAKDSEVPFILSAQRMGFYVIATGYKANRPGNFIADEYVPFDFSDYEGLANLAKELQVDSVSQGCNDHCALAASALGERLQLPGHDCFETAAIIHRKDRFKLFAKEIDLPCPIAESFKSVDDALSFGKKLVFPYIVKPTDSAGGFGVSVAQDYEEYQKALSRAFVSSAAGQVVIEPYIEGTLHSLTTFIVDKRVVAHATANDYSYINPYLTNSGKFPADYGVEATDYLIPVVERVAEELDLVDGLLHLQYIRDTKGNFWIIEMMRRSPGNNYTTCLSYSTSVDWQEWILRAEAGQDVSAFPEMHDSHGIFAYHSIMSDKNGCVKRVELEDVLTNNVIQYNEWNGTGSIITDFLNEKVGNIQLRFSDKSESDSIMAEINNYTHVIME